MAGLRPFLVILLLAALRHGPAAATEPAGFRLRAGAFGGWHATSDDYDVLRERRADLVPGAGPIFGGRLALELDPHFAAELEIGAVAAEAADTTVWLMPVTASMGWRALGGEIVTPIAAVGAGIVANVSGPGSGDADLLLRAGVGVELRVGTFGALRLEGGIFASDGVDGALSWTPVVTLGFDVFVWRDRAARRPPKPPVSERQRPVGCPRGAAPEMCIDSDRDRRIDAFDRCPSRPSDRADGCPDPDADGVVDIEDACPNAAGSELDWGCPRP